MRMLKNIYSKMIKVNERDVHYYTAGQGEPLVVVHGGMGDAGTWLDNINMLADNYKLYVPDLPGFGESQLLGCDYNIPEFTKFMENFIDNLGLDRFNLMGHSIGGGIALNYALRFPEKVKKLVLVSSLCLGREIALWVRLMSVPAKPIGSLVVGVLKTTKWLTNTLMIPIKFVMPLSRAKVNLGSNITTFKGQTLVLSNQLSGLAVPTLVVWGARDEIVPVKQAYAAARIIPDCQIHVFENRGHDVHRAEINEFSLLLTRFLGWQ
jgi:pimeloyl-ACP methyl ester carboxylesterase